MPSLGLAASVNSAAWWQSWLLPSGGRQLSCLRPISRKLLVYRLHFLFHSKFGFMGSQRETIYSNNCLLYGIDSSH